MGKTFEIREAEYETRRFCSDKCRGVWMSQTFVGENHNNWKGGIKESSRRNREKQSLDPRHRLRQSIAASIRHCLKTGEKGRRWEKYVQPKLLCPEK